MQFKACKEEEAQDLLKRYKEHLAKAKLERNYYNKNTKLAEDHRKLVDKNYSMVGGKTSYCHVDAVAVAVTVVALYFERLGIKSGPLLKTLPF